MTTQRATVFVDNSAGQSPIYNLVDSLPAISTPSHGFATWYVRNRGTSSAYIVIGDEMESALLVPVSGVAVQAGPYRWTPSGAGLPRVVLETGADLVITPVAGSV